MHTAFDSSPLLHGYREKAESILVHGAKLFLGSATGNLSVYRIDPPSQPQDPDRHSAPQSSPSGRSASSVTPPPASEPIQVSRGFAKKAIEQLGVIKETNTLVSLSDGHVSLHDLSTLGPQLQLAQTRGALTFAIDTSIQKQVAPPPQDYGPGPLGGMNTLRASRMNRGSVGATANAFRPGAVAVEPGSTLGRQRAGLPDSPSRGWQSASLRGMDAIIKHKEDEKRRALEGARLGGAAAAAVNGGGATQAGEGRDGVMTLVTVLAVGMKRKVVFFRWVDGEFWDTREVSLAHTPRQLAFPTPTKLFMGYNASEYGVLSIPLASDSTVAFTHPATQTASAVGARRDVHAQPPASSTQGPLVDLTAQAADSWGVEDFDLTGTGETAGSSGHATTGGLGAAFGGLGGYIGMTTRGKANVLQMDGGEVLVNRESVGVFFGPDGKPSRRDGIEWPSIPDEVAFAKPYVFAILPAGSVPTLKQSQAPNANFPVLQIRSASTLIAVQTLCFPPLQVSSGGSTASPWTSAPSVRLLTTSASNKPPIYVLVSPNDRGAQDREGSAVWRLDMQGWGRQIDELVQKGEFEEALGLLDSVDEVILEDKSERRALVQGLYGVFLFSQNRFDEAVEIFTELDMNPAKVLALYPPNVAGDLSRNREEWLPIFGGTSIARDSSSISDSGQGAEGAGGLGSLSSSPAVRGAGLVQPTPRTRLGALLTGIRPQSMIGGDASAPGSPSKGPLPAPSPSRDPRNRSNLAADADNTDTASIRSFRSTRDARPPQHRSREAGAEELTRKSLDALGRFLADRRRIFKPILESLPHLESKDHMAMSQIKRDSEWLLTLPNKPLGFLEKDELMAVAQTVDTALFKTFLETKPALVGPLCRVENWCEVEQVEELLKERKKFSELIALYGGKEMHSKALQLLKQFSEDERDEEEKVGPTIRYLQNLGAEFIDVILETAHWVLEENAELGMEIFTADTGKVASFPRMDVVADLEEFDRDLCAAYLEHIIGVLGEGDPEFHDKLIRLYLRKASELSVAGHAAATRDQPEQRQRQRSEVMAKLLAFLRSSSQYRPEHILGRLSANEDDHDMFEARALLLGRMGQHEGALGIYVRKLKDLERAEGYCRDVWTARKRQEEQQGLRRAELGYFGRTANSGVASKSQGKARTTAASTPGTPGPRAGMASQEEQRRKADEGVFLILLQIYLRSKTGNSSGGVGGSAESVESEKGSDYQLEAALSLIQRNASRIDLVSALDLLPPLVSLKSLESFIRLNLRDQTRRENEAKVIRHVRTMRDLQVEETMCRLQSRRVKVGEHRTCPHCHKRLGNSVIAVQPVTGAVMHYFCMLNNNGDHADRTQP